MNDEHDKIKLTAMLMMMQNNRLKLAQPMYVSCQR